MGKLVVVSLALLCLACCASCQLYDDWIKSVSELGETVNFPCLIEGVHPPDNVTGFQVVEWMLPSLKRISPGDTLEGATVDADGWSITINSTQKDDLGIYHCMMQNQNSDWRLIKWGLNMRGPFFEDTLQKYSKNMIIGFSAFGGFLLLTAVVILVYHFRWRAPETSPVEETSKSYPPSSAYPIPESSKDHTPMERTETMKAEEAAAVAALAAATAGEPDIPGTPTQDTVMTETKQPSLQENWSKDRMQGYSNAAYSKDEGSQVANTSF